jgi:hypothetical protein
MKIITTLLLLVFSIVPAMAASPAISPEKPIFLFGQMAEGDKLEHTFRFNNIGDAPLIIKKVRSSCGCTAALLSADVIGPGETGEVKTVFDSSGFSGPVSKTIYLYTNDPVQEIVRFQLSGNVQKEIHLQPARLQFPILTAATASRATLTLTNKGQGTLFLSDLKTTSSEMVAELSVTRLEPEESAVLEVTVTPDEGKLRFAGYITLRTSSPRNPLLRIPVTGQRVESAVGK